MNLKITAGLTLLAGCTAAAIAGNPDADMTVSSISGVSKYGTATNISAYAIGTTSCNVGTVEMNWQDSGPTPEQHPVIAQNIYRLQNDRMEMIGMSWLKHGWCAADAGGCGSCSPSSQGCDMLGIGCSDTYGSGLNGAQGDLGPRNQVNPLDGTFVWPHPAPQGNNTIRGRLQVDPDDLNPSLNAGALYYGESQYIHLDEVPGTPAHDNNNSHRRMLVGSFTSGAYNLSFTGSTQQTQPALQAWQVQNPDVTIETYIDPEGGTFWLAYLVTDNGDGTWHYEYAFMNMNSHAAAREFSVPVPKGVNLTNVEFHAPQYHSGEPYDNLPWTHSNGTWTAQDTDFTTALFAGAPPTTSASMRMPPPSRWTPRRPTSATATPSPCRRSARMAPRSASVTAPATAWSTSRTSSASWPPGVAATPPTTSSRMA